MTQDPLDHRLQQADPARGLHPDAETREKLLAHLRTVEPPRRGKYDRSAPRTLAIVAMLGVAVFAATSVLLAGTLGTNSAARAYAAIDPSPGVLHLRTSTQTVSAAGSLTHAQTTESWLVGERWRSVTRRTAPEEVSGLGETAFDNGVARTWSARRDEIAVVSDPPDSWAPYDPSETFRRHYRRGGVQTLGEARLDGRTVVVFDFRDGDARVRYVVDQETYLPVEVRIDVSDLTTGRKRFSTTTRVDTYERLPSGPDTDDLLTLAPHPGAEVVEVSRRLPEGVGPTPSPPVSGGTARGDD